MSKESVFISELFGVSSDIPGVSPASRWLGSSMKGSILAGWTTCVGCALKAT